MDNVILLLLMLILIILLILILSKKKMSYLNYNSTYYFEGGKFNPSDVNYSEIIDIKNEEAKLKAWLIQYVDAPEDTKVIFNSGSTESIANLIFWAKSYNKYGVVYGSKLDHISVEKNCKNFDVEYKKLSLNKLKKLDIPEDASMVFITGISSANGDIYPIEQIKRYQYLAEEGGDIDQDNMRQYRPLKVLDATQCIGKVKIDMKKDDLNAVFFSLHKIGGNINEGILIIHDMKDCEFKPLICGTQQDKLRGGTYNVYDYIGTDKLIMNFEKRFNREECKKVKKMIEDMLDDAEIEYDKNDKLDNIGNTILIHLGFCNAGLIRELADNRIYVSGVSACNAESGEIDDTLRISYLNDEDINKQVIKKMIKLIKEYRDNN